MIETVETIKKFALIVAGGIGNRMGNSVPKQFIQIAGKALLMHTIKVFDNHLQNIEIILVLPKNQIPTWKNLCEELDFQIQHQITFGGETRFQSVKNGLELIPDDGVVFIHDGVRPLVSKTTLERCLSTTLKKGNALPVLSASESIRRVENDNNYAVDRTKFFMVQTPQTFQCKIIKDAYSTDYLTTFTDDASVAEAFGEKINLVEGNRENIKITYPEDLEFAKAIFFSQKDKQ